MRNTMIKGETILKREKKDRFAPALMGEGETAASEADSKVENKRKKIRSLMIKGYGEMGRINLEEAEAGAAAAFKDEVSYEEFLSESE